MEYISSKRGGGCVLCDAAKDPTEEKLVLYRGSGAFIVMNKFPYNNGHLMVAPVRHVRLPNELTDEEALEIHRLISASIEALRIAMNPDGFNIGVNVGRHAGAGMEHLHYHVVPRWAGDTNFMPVLADVKVIPQHLKATYRELKPVIEKVLRGSTYRGRA